MITKHLSGKRETGPLYAAFLEYAIKMLWHHQHYQIFYHFNIGFCVQTIGPTFPTFPPLEQYTRSHKDYLQLLKEKAEFMGGILLDYKT